jgi:hypothetical protein
MNQLSPEMVDCITKCFNCNSTCLRTAIEFKPTMAADPSAMDHIRLMLACAEMCRTSAQFMIIGTMHHKHTCKECAEICLECAAACEKLGGMQECVDACRLCAESCAKMAA